MTDENLNKDGNVGTENNVSDTGVKRREGRRRNYNRREGTSRNSTRKTTTETAENTKGSRRPRRSRENRNENASAESNEILEKNITSQENENTKLVKTRRHEGGLVKVENRAIAKRPERAIAKRSERSITKREDFRFKKPSIKIIPLGGIEEIGKNITVFEYEDDIIVVDCGLEFPTDDMLGIDLVIPDVTYLVKNKEKVKGMVITHGHEDHRG